jgi:hypothetical protein
LLKASEDKDAFDQKKIILRDLRALEEEFDSGCEQLELHSVLLVCEGLK